MSLELGVIVAAGVLGNDGLGGSLSDKIINKLDTFETVVLKTVTSHAQSGTELPNYTGPNRYNIEGTTLNNVNLRNPGIYNIHPKMNSILRKCVDTNLAGSMLLASIADFTNYKFEDVFQRLHGTNVLKVIELNMGCHTAMNELDPFTRSITYVPLLTKKLVEYLLSHNTQNKQIWLKLPPDQALIKQVIDNKDLMKLCSLVVSNSFPGNIYNNDLEISTNVQNSGVGVSSQATKYINYRTIERLREHIPSTTKIIGCGGVTSIRDVQDYEKAGANGVQIGSLFLHHPETAIVIAQAFKNAAVSHSKSTT